MNEIWKPIQDYPGYEVSNNGRVRSNKRRKPIILNQYKDGERGNYLKVRILFSGKHYNKRVHRLVLETFIGEQPRDMEASHLDGNTKNNCLENLAWETHADNSIRCPNVKLNKLKASWIRLLLERGFSGNRLADEFCVSAATISLIKNNKVWKRETV